MIPVSYLESFNGLSGCIFSAPHGSAVVSIALQRYIQSKVLAPGPDTVTLF